MTAEADAIDMRTESEANGSTSRSLIRRAQQDDPEAWRRLAMLYVPLVYRWARQSNLQGNDAADVVQEVFRSLASRLVDFRHDQPSDTFRGWLYTITRNKIRDHYRGLAQRPEVKGGSHAHDQLHQVPEQLSSADVDLITSDVAHRAIELMKTDFQEQTWQVFWRAVVEGQPPTDIAADLQLSLAAVYQAKSRVLRRLRQELAGMFDQ